MLEPYRLGATCGIGVVARPADSAGGREESCLCEWFQGNTRNRRSSAMRILACVSSFVIVVLGISSAPAFDDAGGDRPYTVTGETCQPKGSSCGGCYTVLIPVGAACSSGFRCDAVGCTTGTTAYKACSSGASGAGCTSNGDNQLSSCTGCETWPGGCVTGSNPGTCSSPGCGPMNGTPINPGIALLCP